MKRLLLLLIAVMLLCMPALAQDTPPQLTLDFSGQGDNVTVFAAQWYDSNTARAFATLLPETLTMSDLNGNEKYAYLDAELPEYGEQVEKILAGDIMLFGNKCIVIFYEDAQTPYNYTRIGRVLNPEALKNALGDWDAVITFLQPAQ